MIYKILQFFKSLFWHIYSGSPKSSQDLIDSRHAICEGCDKFDKSGKQCLVCGCSVNKKKIFMNKLAWLDQKCPEGKW